MEVSRNCFLWVHLFEVSDCRKMMKNGDERLMAIKVEGLRGSQFGVSVKIITSGKWWFEDYDYGSILRSSTVDNGGAISMKIRV
ncbi:hypothetical protein V6N13_113577 [Hibiscus sabdariffa]